MKKTLLLFIFFIFSCSTFSQSNTIIEVAKYIREYEKLAKLEINNIWGISLSTPIIVVVPENEQIITNQRVAGLKKYKNVYYGENKEILSGGCGVKKWLNKNWAFFTYPFPTEDSSRFSLFFHECFHCIQDSLQLKGLWTNCSHLNELSARVLLKLEIKALQVSLRKEGSLVDLKNALCFRQERYLLHKNARKDETSIEILEGLAEYTGNRLTGYSSSDVVKYIDQKSEYNAQSFAYLTGLLYGYILDYSSIDWKKTITINDNFLEFTANAFNIKLPDSISAFNKKNKYLYGYKEILQNEKVKTDSMESLQNKYLTVFWKNPVLEIETKTCTNVVFRSDTIVPFREGKVYNKVKITGNWGQINIEGEVFLGNKILVTEPKTINGSNIKGNGWNLQLNENWQIKKVSQNLFILILK
ncbi:MAG: hypothetical protein PHW19_09505 [Salinivirgaceae bacterium]|nr:hypothetical protein [Salinivirgaceae bacterium]